MSYFIKSIILCSAGLLFLTMFSCGGGSSPTPVSIATLQNYNVKSLIFTGDPSEGSYLEAEVHIVDADTNLSVLCSGVEHGLQVVQAKGTLYDDLDANFIRTDGSSTDEVSSFYVTILERDSEQCPGQPVFSIDTTLARSQNMDYETFQSGTIQLNDHESGTIVFEERGEEPAVVQASELLNLAVRRLSFDAFNTDESSIPDIEIHLVDVSNNRVLACMGGNNAGLETVIANSTDYDSLMAFSTLATDIVETDTATWLRAVLVERDSDACPAPFVVGTDRIIGSTEVTSLPALSEGNDLVCPSEAATVQIVDGARMIEEAAGTPVDDVIALNLTEITFYGDADEYSDPEIEVHLEDPMTGETIACAGANYALAAVIDPGVDYSGLTVPFVQVWDSEGEPSGYIRVVIVDRDQSGCPTAANRRIDNYFDEAVVTFEELTSAPILMGNGSSVTIQ